MAVLRGATWPVDVPLTVPSSVTLTTANVQVAVSATGDPTTATWVAPDSIIGTVVTVNVGPSGTVDWPAGKKAYVLVRVNNIAPLHPIMLSGLIDIQF